MRVVHELSEHIHFNNPILTLGTYDGVHVGHQEIIRNLVKDARAEGKESVLLTFHPHPRMVLYPDSHSVKLIDTVDEKLAKLRKLGLDTVILYPFTSRFSRLSAVEFVRDVLVSQINVSHMVVGHDHHFGKNREGDFSQLQDLGNLYGFTVEKIQPVVIHDVTVSSTKIRNAVLSGDTISAAAWLGVPFALHGTVVHGNKLGRTIGFPTANLDLGETTKILPKHGVYAVRVQLNGRAIDGVMNVGKKPTVQQSEQVFVEVFLFDFNEDIYGERLSVEVYDNIREERKFASLEELTAQLKRDEEIARSVLAGLH